MLNPFQFMHEARLLLLDDEKTNLLLLEGLLEHEGLTNFKSLTDPRQALAVFDEFQPDLILLDLMMPHLDGLQVMEQLQKRLAPEDYLPILVLTANLTPDVKTYALRYGAHDFLVKPLNLVETSLRIRNLLRTRFLHMQLKNQNQRLEEQVRQRTAELQRANTDLEQRVAERTAELRQSNFELERALLVKDEFLANMSHELRTPLNAVLGLSESLAEQTAGPLNEKQQKYVATILESGQHLLDLINDILDLAKIEAGQVTLSYDNVGVSQVCQSSLRMIKQLALKKNLEVVFELDPSLDSIIGDERRLKQMIVNLLSNAVKFTPENGKIGLQVRGDRENNVANFMVWDTGIGIKEDDLPRLFRPFVQLESKLARKLGGTGLGLALVARMAALHGGGVSVESQPDQGSCFTITLPWESALTADATARLSSRKSQVLKPDLARQRHTLLLVEDTEAVVMVIRDYLEYAGFKVATAPNGVEAIAMAEAIVPSLILMDIQLPVMDGLEATRRIRGTETLKNIPIIALTALAMKGDRERCLEAGMNDYLSKPVNLKELIRVIENHIS